MASKLLQIPLHFFKQTNNLTLSSPFIIQKNHFHRKFIYYSNQPSRISFILSSSSPKPPTTKQEAILQAKSLLSSTLTKPLNTPKLTGKIKKVKQPRFCVEIPVIDDDSPSSLSQLALEVFGELPVKKKGSRIKILILWASPVLTRTADEAFLDSQSPDILVENIDISSSSSGVVTTGDMAVFMAPEASQLGIMKTIADGLNPRPVVMFNPKWQYKDEANFGEMRSFVGSFEVIYSFMGLEVRGILSKRKGVVFKCGKEGKWDVMVEEETGKLRVVSRFQDRPSMDEVENVLYNLMAVNSPLTKSAKFLKDLVSNVVGKNK